MDRISTALLNEFSTEHGLDGLEEESRFEHFTAWLTIRRHFSETAFDTREHATGKGSDTGIDAIAIIVNNNLVTDIDEVENLVVLNGYLDVTFIFVQAERSAHFETAKIGQFGFGVRDFFGAGKLPRNEKVQHYAEIMSAIFAQSSRFRPTNPYCYLYYVTTGQAQNDQALNARADAEVSDLRDTGMFGGVTFNMYGANNIQKLYRQTKNAISREFVFARKTVAPEVAGVREAYLGYIPATEFLKLVCDDDGNVIKSLFYENIRDWVGYNNINSEIRDTLGSDSKDRFILMNNGATMIARTLTTVGDKFSISDFQVVNGCQTSHVLHDNEALLTAAVQMPFRIVCTQDESVIESIIRATNRQTAVRDDQFFAMKDFAKKLEEYFRSFPVEHRLYYERRPHQYDSFDIDRRRIIVHPNLVRAVGAMFLAEPHITTRNFRALSEKVGRDIFLDSDKFELYYVAAYTLYRLEQQFSVGKVDPHYKPARYQLLMAARYLLGGPAPLPNRNSNEMGKRCNEMMQRLWDDAVVDETFAEARAIVEKVAGTDWNRDTIRTEPMTKAISDTLGPRITAAGAI